MWRYTTMIKALFFNVIKYVRFARLDYALIRFARSVLGNEMCKGFQIDRLFKFALEVKTDEYQEI